MAYGSVDGAPACSGIREAPNEEVGSQLEKPASQITNNNG